MNLYIYSPFSSLLRGATFKAAGGIISKSQFSLFYSIFPYAGEAKSNKKFLENHWTTFNSRALSGASWHFVG